MKFSRDKKDGLFVTKPLQSLLNEAVSNTGGLRRKLSKINLMFIGIGAIIGAGIFVVTGTAAAMHAGPALVLSFILSAFGCALCGMCYAEFASMIPIAGSAYTYSYTTMGELVAWIIGWDLVLEYLFGASAVAVGWSGYFNSFLNGFGIYLPTSICQSPFIFDGRHFQCTGALINFPAVFIVAITNCVLVLGISQSARVNNIIVLMKIAVILFFIGFGVSYIHPENWHPFIPKNTGEFGSFGISGIIAGAGVIFFAYIGFDAISTTAQEAKNPQKDMPFGILISLLVCTVLYISVCLVMTGLVSYKKLNVDAPIAVAIDTTGKGLTWLMPIIKIGAIAGLSSVVLILQMGMSRIVYTMSRDGLLPQRLGKIHHKYRTPYVSTLLTGFATAIFAGLLPIGLLNELVSIGTLLAFAIVCIGIIVMRHTQPDAPRSFKTPLVPFVPILGALICFIQMYSLPTDRHMDATNYMDDHRFDCLFLLQPFPQQSKKIRPY